MHNNRNNLALGLLATALALSGCEATKGLLDVENPGPIPDAQLNTAASVPGLVAGMSGDLSLALRELVQANSVMSDDLFHSGSYTAEGLWNRGVIRAEDVNGLWANLQRARFVAENGLERMKNIPDYQFNNNALTARAYLFAGFSNRMLGENMCFAVFDGGAPMDHKEHFRRAEAHFTEVLRNTQTDVLRRAALGGRAAARLALGELDGAAADAAQVPTSFVFDAVMSLTTTRQNNQLVTETTNRREYTVFNTQWARTRFDPRTPWDTVRTTSGGLQTGQDGRTRFFRQTKYRTLDANIPLTKGTEMLMVRAEVALRKGDIPAAFQLINTQRAFYGLPALSTPTDRDQAWRTLQRERGAVLWIETRRFWDLRRWYAENLRQFMQEPGDPRLATWGTRDQCIPISENERRSNPNIPD
ncbi:hypothetical protein BH24GEM2_BH24GEM2_13310 [soil metagenome]